MNWPLHIESPRRIGGSSVLAMARMGKGNPGSRTTELLPAKKSTQQLCLERNNISRLEKRLFPLQSLVSDIAQAPREVQRDFAAIRRRMAIVISVQISKQIPCCGHANLLALDSLRNTRE